MRQRTRQASSGFTLLEVLVALSILGVAVLALVQLFSANLKSISASEEQVSRSLEAQSKMREVLTNKEFSERTWNGVTDNGTRFEVSVSEALSERVENLPVKLVRIEVKILWTHGSRDKALTLTTLKMVPKEI